MRAGVVVSIFLFASAAAQAQSIDFSGKWSVSGNLASGGGMMIIAPVCDLKQAGDQIAGPCKGPNGSCSAVGVVNGADIDMTCRTTSTNHQNLAGFSTFHGTLGGDNIVRGTWAHSRFPGASGRFTMMRA
jgi:hypothetical protein